MDVRIGMCLLITSYMYQAYADSNEEEKIRTYFFGEEELAALSISDWVHPSFDDYALIQKQLDRNSFRARHIRLATNCFNNVQACKWYSGIAYRFERLRLIDTAENPPVFTVIPINGNAKKKDTCIICYAGYPTKGRKARDYERGVLLLIKALYACHFDGHLLYRKGGWPNLSGGRLKYADVPYGFKPFMFEEARDLGYTKIVWLDASCIPCRKLDPLFDIISKHGCCFADDGMVRDYVKDMGHVMRALEMDERKQYKYVGSSIIGLDINNKKASTLLNRWIKAAEKRVPFLEPNADELSFALLVNECDLLDGKIPEKYLAHGSRTIHGFSEIEKKPAAVIDHNYDFLNPDIPIPDTLFDQQ